MYKQNHKFLEKKLEEKVKRRDKKKKKNMKVSGWEVKKIQKIIKEK